MVIAGNTGCRRKGGNIMTTMYRITKNWEFVMGMGNPETLRGILYDMIKYGKVPAKDKEVAIRLIPRVLTILEKKGKVAFYQYEISKININ